MYPKKRIFKVFAVVFAFLLIASGGMNSKAFAAETKLLEFDPAATDAFCKLVTGSCSPSIDWEQSTLTATDVKATPIGTPEETDQNTLFMGSAELENESATVTQSLKSQEFKKDFTDSVTTTVTEGWKAGGSLSLNATIKEIFGLSGTATGEYNYSESEAKTKTSTATYTSPAQSINVPPRAKAIVTVNLQRVNSTGKVSLDALIGGDLAIDNSEEDNPSMNPVYDLFKNATSKGYQLPPQLSLDDSAQKLRFKGSGEWTADYGSKYKVNVQLVDLDTGEPKFFKNKDGKNVKSYSFEVPVKKGDVDNKGSDKK
ncbi:toxin ETX/toxin MTX2 [Marininema mesophilum]|uniref:Toxin ETX/toxin MTX2 n=1 Tax=Marininema mesophilum TaxID=1048340 RepID=A0A1H2QUQ6_9BACL|nr:ETX/MTX2 family pore-forming toxin [Marininema mesophilum]SDW10871.1 toxin ETX/toxin MTX2 [Marininema mesophilum]